MTPVALTVAGSDPSGGAGLQADLKTFHRFGVYGMSVVAVLTVQNTRRVVSVDPLAPEYVQRQLDAVMEDIEPNAAKTGALGAAAIVELVASWAEQASFPVVVDPVMVSTSGAALIEDQARRALAEKLAPQAFLLTPNLEEAQALSGIEIDGLERMGEAARRILDLGPAAVLIKGGHLPGDAIDLLLFEGAEHRFPAPRIATRHTHGSGCTYSAAITAELAKGRGLLEAVGEAKRFVTAAIASAPGLGGGAGPLNHFAELRPPQKGENDP